MAEDKANLDALQANINARRQAENLLSLVDELVEGVRPLSMQRFWESVAAEAAARAGMLLVEDCPTTAKPMNDDEAMRFEASIVPMGKHLGEMVLDVPIGYWLAITENDFYRKLRRYLRSDRFARRQ